MKVLGKGLSCSSNEDTTGELVYIKNVQDVIELFDNAFGKICLVEDAGTTTLGPILSDIKGVVCTSGGPGSHLAIVSREFDIPCIMAIDIQSDMLSKLDGKKAQIITKDEDEGILYLKD